MATVDHKAISNINQHVVHAWSYANSTAREGASGFVTADLNKLALQTDEGTYWRLTATTPTWEQFNPLLDEDDFASNSATHAPTQQSVGAYTYKKSLNLSDLPSPATARTNLGLTIPEGIIFSWVPGYFTDGSNGGYTYVLPSDNTVAAANTYLNPKGYYVCDGSALNDADSVIFNGANRYLPNLTDSRFLMGSTSVGSIGGATSTSHTHDVTTTNHTHTLSSHTHTLSHTHTWSGTYGTYWDNYGGGAVRYPPSLGTVTTSGASTSTTSGPSTSDTSSGGAETVSTSLASNTENRPLFLSCFYIMRVKNL